MSKAIDSLHSSRADARTDLLHGTLDMLILRTLQWGSQHGYAISQAISRTVRRRLQVEAGSLYPALQRGEKGWAVTNATPGSGLPAEATGARYIGNLSGTGDQMLKPEPPIDSRIERLRRERNLACTRGRSG
jgi:Transcriptional regulator PadR-like family